jgi:hypothetical protein
MLEVIDTRDPATPAHIGQHPTKPFALVRYCRTWGGKEVVTLIDRHASKAEADAGLLAIVRRRGGSSLDGAFKARIMETRHAR